MQARPVHAAAPGGENAEGVETSREALQKGVRGDSNARVFGKPKARCSGWVLGQPLKRSRSPREEPENKPIVSRGPGARRPWSPADVAKGMRGAPKQ